MAETVLARAKDTGWTGLSNPYLLGFDLSASALRAFTEHSRMAGTF